MLIETQLRSAPLALIAEDHEPIRRNAQRKLEDSGIETLVADSLTKVKQAVAKRRWPEIALIDIHLDPHNAQSPNMEGLDIARYLRQDERAIYIVGYSGKFDEGSIDTRDLDLFDHIAKKGKLGLEEHRQLWKKCVETATFLFQEHRLDAVNHLDSLRRKYERSESARLSHVERLHGCKVPPDLTDAGFDIMVAHAGETPIRLVDDLPLWIQHVSDADTKWVNLEVFGHPELYASGHTETEALQTLEEFMRLVQTDLRTQPGSEADAELDAFLQAVRPE